MKCSIVGAGASEVKDVDLGPLDALQYPSLAVEALQTELAVTRHNWRVDVKELESLFESSQPEKPEEAWKEEVAQLKQDLESMTGRYEAALRENVEGLRMANRDIKELEDMVSLLADQNAQLQNKLDSMQPATYGGPDRGDDHDAIKHSDSEISQNSSVIEPLVEPDVMSPIARSASPDFRLPSQIQNSSPLSQWTASMMPVMYFNIDKDPETTMTSAVGVNRRNIPALP